jgi:uncharacterized protein (DUF4415 family)
MTSQSRRSRAGSLIRSHRAEPTTRIPLHGNTPEWGTPDEDTPELTAERAKGLMTAAEFYATTGFRPPGRPKSAAPKVSVHIRLDADLVEHFKRDGDGWQTRLNRALGELVRSRRPR